MARVPAVIINPMRREEALAALTPIRRSMMYLTVAMVTAPVIAIVVLLFTLPDPIIVIPIGVALLACDLYVLTTLRRQQFERTNAAGEPGNELWLPGSLLKGMEVGPMVSEASMYEAAQIVRSHGDRTLAQSRLR